MASLAQLPELVGFFSYSREDDEAFRGSLSALRDAIQRDLSAQLGRNRRNFRLWQDQEAIAPGKLWELQIAKAIEEAAFFIPIVTPRAVTSTYCKFEFESFLARERSLGRADLVFPIVYISVPALLDETEWRNDMVLSVVAKRQYVDWRSYRYLSVDTPAFGQAIEHFCGKIAETLREPWLSPEERRQQEAETEDRPEEINRLRVRVEAEAQKQAGEEKLHRERQAKKPENEERKHEEVELRQQESEAKRREVARHGKLDERTRANVGAYRPAESDLAQLPEASKTETKERSARLRRLSSRGWIIAGIFVALIAAGATIWLKQYQLKEQVHPQTTVTAPAPAAEKQESSALTNATPLTLPQELALKPGDSFKECPECPEMIVVPAGTFRMGSPAGQGTNREHPQHDVTIARFAVARFPVTFNQWHACAAADHGCRKDVSDDGQPGDRPVTGVNFDDARVYIQRLAAITQKPYRFISEAEREYAARAQIQTNGKPEVNTLGLHDMAGNFFEWTGDCWNPTYQGTPPADGSPWKSGNCSRHPVRGGDDPADRRMDLTGDTFSNLGFRVARTLNA